MAKPGKYDAIIPGLPPLPPENLAKQDKVDELKKSVLERDADTLAERYIRLRAEKDEINEELSAVNLLITVYEQLLAESQNAGADGWGRYGVKDNAIRLASGDTVRVQQEPYGKVVDKEVFRLWCIANGYERLLQLWPSTMNALVKEHLVAGQPEPDGTEAYSYAKVVLVKKGAAE